MCQSLINVNYPSEFSQLTGNYAIAIIYVYKVVRG